MEIDQDYKTFMKQLKPFPNYFQMDAEDTKPNVWGKVKQKLLDETEDFKDMCKIDRFRNLNLLGCVHYYLGDLKKAKDSIELVLIESGLTNINAYAMRAKMYYIQGEITKSKEIVQKLQELAKDPYKIDIAKGELCYAWSRMEPKHYKKGIDELKKIVSKYSDKPEYPIWTFALALMYRRCLHLSVKSLHPDLDDKQCFNGAKELLNKNILMREIEPIYKARCYIELANLLALRYISLEINNSSDEEIYSLIVEGVELAPDCASVLMKAGKVMKFIKEYIQSEAYLQRAYELRPNSFNCHQLALIMKSNIIFANRNKNNSGKSDNNAGTFQRYNSPSTPRTSYPSIQKRHGQGSTQSQDVRNDPYWSPNQTSKSTITRSTPTNTKHQQSHKKTVVEKLFKPEASSSKRQLAEKRSSFNNPDLEEDNASPEGCCIPVLEDPLVCNFKNMTLDQRPNKTTEKVNFENKTKLSTSETNQKEVLPNYGPCPQQSIQPCNPCDQPGQEDLPSSEKVPIKLSACAQEFIPMQVEKQMTVCKPTMQVKTQITPCKPTMKTIMKSPQFRCLGYKVSKQLGPCLRLFKKAVEYSKNTNFPAYYDWGLTLLHMYPPNYKEALNKFNYVIQYDESMNKRCSSFQQAGICRIKMSEDKHDTDREYHRKDACEMFKRAIRCWADCQRMKLHEYYDNAEQNCDSMCSIREILGDKTKRDTQQTKDLADMYHLIRQYDLSMELYEELRRELEHDSNGQDGEVIKGIIKNRLKLEQFDDVLDLLSVYISSTEGLYGKEFKFDVLKEMMHYAIVNNDSTVAGSVIDFDFDSNFSYHIIILYNEKDQSSKQLRKCLGDWLGEIGFKITCNTILLGKPHLHQGQNIRKSRMAICIINDDSQCKLFNFVMEMTLTEFLADGRQIFPVLLNDSKLDVQFKPFKSFSIDNNFKIDQQKINILKAFCDIYLASRNTSSLPQAEAYQAK